MNITYYAGAADAAGVSGTQLDTMELTAAQLTALLGQGNPRLAEVLPRCTRSSTAPPSATPQT